MYNVQKWKGSSTESGVDLIFLDLQVQTATVRKKIMLPFLMVF
jgi:hypothetical protein